ncbi:MAG: hypothetical protein ACJ0SL_04465 [Candidatus Rariloculaceae bacterium]
MLARQPAGRYLALAEGLSAATSGVVPMALDPSRGDILGLLIQSPSLFERIQQGGIVGYVIIWIRSRPVESAISRLPQSRSNSGVTGNAGSASLRLDAGARVR